MVLVAVSVCLATIVLNLHYRSPHHQSPSSLWHFSLAGSRALTGCRPGWGTSSYRGCRGSSWWESPSRSSRAALEREEVNIWGRRTRRLQVVCLFVCFPSAKSDTPELTEEPPPSADANGFNSEKNGYKVRIFLSSHSTDQNTNIAGKQRQAQWAAQDAFGLNIWRLPEAHLGLGWKTRNQKTAFRHREDHPQHPLHKDSHAATGWVWRGQLSYYFLQVSFLYSRLGAMQCCFCSGETFYDSAENVLNRILMGETVSESGNELRFKISRDDFNTCWSGFYS